MTRVLIADDENDIMKSTAQWLELEGFEVSGVTESSKILPELLKQRPDILLQDVRMPGLDLMAFMSTVRNEPRLKGLVVVIFTASLDGDDVAKRFGADDFCPKPFAFEDLVALLKKHEKKA